MTCPSCSPWSSGWAVFVRFSTVKLLFFSFFHTVLSGRMSLCAAHSWEEELCSTSFRIESICVIHLKFFCSGNLSIPTIIYLFDHIFICIWDCKYLFLFCVITYNDSFSSNYSVFGRWGPFMMVLTSLWHTLIMMCECFLFYLMFLPFRTARCSRLIWQISCPRTGIDHFFKEPWSLLLKNGFRNQDLSDRCAHCYWSVVFLGLQSKEIHVCV